MFRIFKALPLFLTMGANLNATKPFVCGKYINITPFSQAYEKSACPSPQKKLAQGLNMLIRANIENVLTNNPRILKNVLDQNPGIVKNVLDENPGILAHVLTYMLPKIFNAAPHILFEAQQNMIKEFSEKTSDSIQKHTHQLLSNTPELWQNLQKNPLNPGAKNIVVFLSPLCIHSLFLLKDLLSLARLSQNSMSICPHFVTQHNDEKGQWIVRSILAAHALGKIAPFLERILDQMPRLSDPSYMLKTASELGMNPEQFMQHMQSQETQQQLIQSRSYGNQFQFKGFPTILYKKENHDAQQNPYAFEIVEGRPEDANELASLLSS